MFEPLVEEVSNVFPPPGLPDRGEATAPVGPRGRGTLRHPARLPRVTVPVLPAAPPWLGWFACRFAPGEAARLFGPAASWSVSDPGRALSGAQS